MSSKNHITQYPKLRLFIAGEWQSGDDRDTVPVVNPATEEVLGEVPLATRADLDRALESAANGFRTWRAVAPSERAKILRRAAELLRERTEEIATIATLEMGKAINEMRGEVGGAASLLEWYAEEARRTYGRVLPQRAPGQRLTVVKEPVGPVAAFSPWNHPIMNPAGKIGPILAAGCSCILKPAEETPATALAVVQAFIDAGLPPGVLSVVFGRPPEVSSHLIASPVIRAMTFTGSVPVGKELTKLAAEGMKRTVMELGGHAPVIVFDDVDVDQVLDMAINSKFYNAGQICVSPTRFYIHESIYDKFVDGFTARVKALPVGDGLDPNNRMGPLAHPRRLSAMETLISDAVDHGARLCTGGSRLDRTGYFWAPTVLADVPNSARIMNEEPFGPVAVLNSFKDFDAVIEEANRLPYGLAAYGFSKSARNVNLLGEQLEAGIVSINSFQIFYPEAPFGGVKESGHGSEEGIEGVNSFLVTKAIGEV